MSALNETIKGSSSMPKLESRSLQRSLTPLLFSCNNNTRTFQTAKDVIRTIFMLIPSILSRIRTRRFTTTTRWAPDFCLMPLIILRACRRTRVRSTILELSATQEGHRLLSKSSTLSVEGKKSTMISSGTSTAKMTFSTLQSSTHLRRVIISTSGP